MQRAELVLSILNKKSKEDNKWQFKRLYRNLFNPDLFLNAYAKIYRKEGNMTKGIDGKTIDGFGMTTINKLIEELRSERYKPKPVRRKYIPKKDGRKRPLGIPTVEDKLVQEVVRQIIEAIYEPQFSNTSHGFRPNRSCHTALEKIKKNCNGCSWIIEGDIKGFFDNINHDKMLKILKTKINDGRFINLIEKFLKAGIMEEGKIRDSITGTPQGGICSPILANIYLNELDKYMEKLKDETEIGIKRKANPEYVRLSGRRRKNICNKNYEEAKRITKLIRKIPSKDPMDQNFRRMKYYRYADDFVILIHGPKAYAEELKEKLSGFLETQLKITLNSEKTLITNLLKEKALFLGYEIIRAQDNSKITKRNDGFKVRSINGVMQLLVPNKVIKTKLKPFVRNGKSVHIKSILNLTVKEMINKYNSEIRGLYNYYCLAGNVGKRIGTFKYYHYFSLVKSIAAKHKISVKKTIKRFGIPVKKKLGTGTRNTIGTIYEKKNGERKTLIYFNDSLKRKPYTSSKSRTIEEFNPSYKNEIIRRLLNEFCELCHHNIPNEQLIVHQIRSLKKMKEKYKRKKGDTPGWAKLMMRINRKTLVVCKHCHKKIHGKFS